MKGEDKMRVHCPDHGFSETGTQHTRFNWDLNLGEEVKGEDKLRFTVLITASQRQVRGTLALIGTSA